MNVRVLSAMAAVGAVGAHASAATIVNGSFETGDFAGWVTSDIAVPFEPLAVLPGGTITGFDGFLRPNTVIPSDGVFAASHGFDGDGLGAPGLCQHLAGCRYRGRR